MSKLPGCFCLSVTHYLLNLIHILAGACFSSQFFVTLAKFSEEYLTGIDAMHGVCSEMGCRTRKEQTM